MSPKYATIPKKDLQNFFFFFPPRSSYIPKGMMAISAFTGKGMLMLRFTEYESDDRRLRIQTIPNSPC